MGRQCGCSGQKPGHDAAALGCPQGNAEKAAVLLAAGANPNLHGVDGDTPLILAAKGRSPEMISMLLAAGADALATNESGLQAKDYCSPGSASWALLEELALDVVASKPESSRGAPRI